MRIDSSSFLANIRVNKIAYDKDNGSHDRPRMKGRESLRKLSIIRIVTFLIIFAVSFSSIIPGGLFNHQIALADTGAIGNTSDYNASTGFVPAIAPLNPAYVAYVNSKTKLMAMALSSTSPIARAYTCATGSVEPDRRTDRYVKLVIIVRLSRVLRPAYAQ